jgi:hypothetical protein
MSDPFARFDEHTKDIDIRHTGLVAKWLEVTANDSTDNLGTDARTGKRNIGYGLLAETTGTIDIIDRYDTAVTLPVNAGVPLPCSVSRVKTTGSVSTGIKVAIAP